MESTIHPALGVAIMMNNYLHNVAAALLGASGVALWVILIKYESHPNHNDRAMSEYFLSLYSSMTRVARLSLYWILIGGVPRTFFYRDFEWVTAVKHGQVPALIVNHILIFALVGTGVYLWLKLKKRVRIIEESRGPLGA
jgi:hypothetical protein